MATLPDDETKPGHEAVRAAQERGSRADANQLSVKLELQADCLAGVWANHADETKHILEQGDVESALLLIRAGARVDAPGPDGRTPLMYAAMFDRLELLDLLLQSGADLERADAQGQRPLALARTMGAQRTLARLQRTYDA